MRFTLDSAMSTRRTYATKSFAFWYSVVRLFGAPMPLLLKMRSSRASTTGALRYSFRRRGMGFLLAANHRRKHGKLVADFQPVSWNAERGMHAICAFQG